MLRLLSMAIALAVAAGPAMAANARNPYGNIDRRVDAGNDTGDSRVDQLNSSQLNQNYYHNGGAPAYGAPPMASPPGYPGAPRP